MDTKQITITYPDDWHVHLRNGEMLQTVISATAQDFRRAIVMPNLNPPITTSELAKKYFAEITAAAKNNGFGSEFTPLMTAYLTDNTDHQDLINGFSHGILTAAKLYPAGATTNSDHGVTNIDNILGVLAAMEEAAMPLLIHGEVVGEEYDIFDREKIFIEQILERLCLRFPNLPIVLEHITTEHAVDFVTQMKAQIAATITPHHLMINRSTIFRGGIRPHLYCLPIAKRENHRLALRKAATSGDARFFLGTDSAPHVIAAKESSCGCAGIFNAATALSCYAQVFDEEQALDKFEAFASFNGPDFYRLPRNTDTITLQRCDQALSAQQTQGAQSLETFLPDTPVYWRVITNQ